MSTAAQIVYQHRPGVNTCYDCRERFASDAMHLIKAPTLNGRALICDPCHVAEVGRITEFNRSIHSKEQNL